MICPSCDRETTPFAELGDMMSGGKLTRRCGFVDCKSPLPAEDPPPKQKIVRNLATDLEPVTSSKSVEKRAQTNGAPPSFAQIVAHSEARLVQVRERIAELRALETEEKQLVLILAAAGKTVPEIKPS